MASPSDSAHAPRSAHMPRATEGGVAASGDAGATAEARLGKDGGPDGGPAEPSGAEPRGAEASGDERRRAPRELATAAPQHTSSAPVAIPIASPAPAALGLDLGRGVGANPRRASSASTPPTPGTPGTPSGHAASLTSSDLPPSRPQSARLSTHLGRRASRASLASEDGGIDVSRLDLRPVFTPPPGSEPLPALPSPAHPLSATFPASPGHSPGPTAAVHSHHHQHHRRTSTASAHAAPSSQHTPSAPHSLCGSVHASPLLSPVPSAAGGAPPTLAETGLRLTPDSSHASGQLERRSPRPGLVRLNSFGGEGLDLKRLSRRGSETGESEGDECAAGHARGARESPWRALSPSPAPSRSPVPSTSTPGA